MSNGDGREIELSTYARVPWPRHCYSARAADSDKGTPGAESLATTRYRARLFVLTDSCIIQASILFSCTRYHEAWGKPSYSVCVLAIMTKNTEVRYTQQ